MDGRVAGTWRYQDDRVDVDDGVDVTAFEPLLPAVMVEVRAEADALTAFHLG